tara:strand:- start:703 stop:1008 length:306 start_codon:yes stop_codon:yes gene_type:complete
MNKKKSLKNEDKGFEKEVSKKQINDLKIKELRNKISRISYEESLKKLDLILDDLQNENISIDDICYKYLEGQIYLEHCENLLQIVEQEVIEINPDSLEEIN